VVARDELVAAAHERGWNVGTIQESGTFCRLQVTGPEDLLVDIALDSHPGRVDGFRPIAAVIADEHARIAFGKVGVCKDDRYALSVNDEGAILLTPVATIPARELFVWENEDLKASLLRGVADAAEGNIRRLEWLTEDDND
jgi:hypothetical protein